MAPQRKNNNKHIVIIAILIILISNSQSNHVTASPISGFVFSDPFGYLGHSPYQPRITIISSMTIEDTSFDVNNPDLNQQSSCFGVPWDQLWHAGEDKYDSRISTSQGTTSGAEVKAVADGTVRFASNVSWPGSVIIIEHNTPTAHIFSVYGHILPGSVTVQVNDDVIRGQILGTIMYLEYDGYWPQFHTSGDDSHLHFEMRYFLDASNIYANPACNGLLPGRGYTYPSHPIDFPSPYIAHYVNPTQSIWFDQWHHWLPIIQYEEGS